MQLFILQHYATLERYSLLAYMPYRYGSYLKTQLMQSNALIITVSLDKQLQAEVREVTFRLECRH